ncbi:MAG: uroporphyrinogen decarboxylase family protein [Clostridia bacterium]|nr:uroporphyrinogen decarboxylase family protein [Clostridia bacterium]
MKAHQFDYDVYERFCEENNRKAQAFARGDFLPVSQWTLGKNAYAANSRDKEAMLAEQLDAITQVMETPNDWIPYLEPWHGVGVFAEAFGCPFTWTEDNAPWTRTIISDLESLQRLSKPRLKDAKLLQYVLRTTEYFNEQTKGRLSIAATDTQSPVDTLTLICDPTWFMTEAYDHPDEFHRVLSDITDLIIEFTLKQRDLCTKPIGPGHTMWSPDVLGGGISISEDVLVMMDPDFYDEFAKPYNERIAKALGGGAIHSCGPWAHNFDRVKQTRGLTMVDLAISKVFDPGPNLPETVVMGFENTDIPVQVRADYRDEAKLNTLLRSDVRTILTLWWDDAPAVRTYRYQETKARWEAYHS